MNEVYQFHAIKSGHVALVATGVTVLPVSPSNGQAIVTAVNTSVNALAGRRLIEITNEDATNKVRIGDNAGLAVGAGGTLIPVGAMRQFWVTAEVALYALADAATPTISWNEYA